MRLERTPGLTPKPAAATALRFGQQDPDYDRRDPGEGRRGPVRQLQRDLATLGHFDSPHGATGGYFAATRSAVRDFQSKHGIRPTGNADGQTIAAIRAALNSNGTTTPPAAAPAKPAAAPAKPAPAPAEPAPALPKDTYKPTPGMGTERLQNMSQSELARLGREDKAAFFAALRPSAEEVERRYGIPVAVTLAQIAYESGWAKSVPGGDSFNLFGHKGVGPAGSVKHSSWESNRSFKKTSSFKKYHNFHEAVLAHGANYKNSGYYGKAMAGVNRGERDARTFLQRIEGVYHNDGGSYTSAAMSIIKKHHLA